MNKNNKNSIKPIVMSSANLYLRPIQKEDVYRGWYEWINNSDISKNISSIFYKTHENLLEYIEASKPPNAMLFAICDHNDIYFGNARVSEVDWINKSCTYGRFIGDPDYRSKGYGTEILFLLLDYCFNSLGMNRVYTKVFSDNVASNKSNIKVGMTLEGTLREAQFSNGHFLDLNVYSMLKSDYISIGNHEKAI